jgi:TonB family protein
MVRASAPLDRGREADALHRASRRFPRLRPVTLRQGGANLEPSVVGVFPPVILWPAGLSERLTDAELDAILAHELCHITRRDTSIGYAHVAVETIFWFYPLVWWLGARLVHERERACDEEVVDMGTDTRSYAEGILKVCEFCLRSPAAFVAGVGGSHLAQRIERILTGSRPVSRAPSTRLLVAAVALVLSAPSFATGLASAHRSAAAPAGAAQERTNVYKPGNGVKAPVLVREYKPRYTKAAMDAKIQGIVRMSAVILETGDVGDVVVTQSLDKEYGLDDEAVRTVKRWEFKPGTKDDKPVPVQVEIEMSFKLK